MRGPPGEVVPDFSIDDFDEVLGVAAVLERVGVVERLPKSLVNRMKNLAELGAAGAASCRASQVHMPFWQV